MAFSLATLSLDKLWFIFLFSLVKGYFFHFFLGLWVWACSFLNPR
ncbi:hypothetical protein DB41_CP00140 [Neochlamydia sp. TUME1]|nr:hypothetical protein DB41_CP00140 [Neochlamydia sp. TUME1]